MKLFRRALSVLALFVLAPQIWSADLVITAANVKQVTGLPQQYTAGATITAGQCVYIEAATNTAKLAKANTTTALAQCVGIALNGASANQPIIVLTGGQITIGATPVVGTVYVVSAANAGGVAPWADLAATNIVSFIGYGFSATDIIISIQNTGLSHP